MRHAAARMGTHSLFGASELALYIGMLFAKPNRHRRVTAALRVRAGKPLAVPKKKGTRMTAPGVLRDRLDGPCLAPGSAFWLHPAAAHRTLQFSLTLQIQGPTPPLLAAIV